MRRLGAAALVVLAFVATISPWAVRNARLEKAMLPIDSMGGRNFMMGNYEYTPMFRAWDAVSIEGARSWHAVLAATTPNLPQTTQGQRDKLAMRAGVRYAIAHPWLTFRRDVVKLFNFWGLERELIAGAGRGYFGSPSPAGIVALTALILGSYAALMLLATFGAVVTPPEDARVRWLFFLLLAFFSGIHAATFGHSRYHLPLIPIVAVFAASAIVHVGQLRQRAWTKSFWAAAMLSGLLILGWFGEVVLSDGAHYWEMLRIAGAGR